MSVVDAPDLSPNQRRTLKARQALARKFDTPEAKSAYFRALGERGNANRLLLRPDEAAVLEQATAILARLFATSEAVSDDGV